MKPLFELAAGAGVFGALLAAGATVERAGRGMDPTAMGRTLGVGTGGATVVAVVVAAVASVGTGSGSAVLTLGGALVAVAVAAEGVAGDEGVPELRATMNAITPTATTPPPMRTSRPRLLFSTTDALVVPHEDAGLTSGALGSAAGPVIAFTGTGTPATAVVSTANFGSLFRAPDPDPDAELVPGLEPDPDPSPDGESSSAATGMLA